MPVQTLASLIGYEFRNPDLLRQALTHRSHSAVHNERLEFLGDSVLNCIVATLLYERFPQLPEGELSRLRASLVNQKNLFETGRRIELGAHLLLGDGEIKTGGARRPSIVADALEALIGAIYLDGGFDATRGSVQHLLGPAIDVADPRTAGKDAKTLLQELLQARRMPVPQYSVIATTGEAHQQCFRVECAIPELNIRTEGEGTSRRSAEQAAARRAYDLGSRM